MSTDGLLIWTHAQLDGDELVAHAATEGATGVWRVASTSGGVEYGQGPRDWPDSSSNGVVVYDEGAPTRAQAEHIANWDPKRALAEVKARRRRLSRIEIALAEDPGDAEAWDLARLEALPYAARSGYREEWRP